jgi:hypothetical protein
MQNFSFLEKRLFPRFAVSIPLSYFNPSLDKTMRTQTRDISAEGLCILTDRVLAPATSLDIFLQMIDDGKKIYRKGKVVWVNVSDSDKYRIGIKLEPPKLDSIALVLRTIIAQKEY